MAGGSAGAPDEVTLRLPGDVAYASIARTAAMELGLRAGFAWPVLTALALAVDETMVLLLGSTDASPEADGMLVLRFTVAAGTLDIAVTADGGRHHLAPHGPSMDRFGALIADTVDDWSVDTATATVHLSVRSPGPDPSHERT
jgi:hypothetical protein